MTLEMEATYSSETLESTYSTTWPQPRGPQSANTPQLSQFQLVSFIYLKTNVPVRQAKARQETCSHNCAQACEWYYITKWKIAVCVSRKCLNIGFIICRNVINSFKCVSASIAYSLLVFILFCDFAAKVPITVVARSKAWIVFACSNARIVDSNPTHGVDILLCVFCLCVR
jgi:hypothetical protein